MQGKSYDLGEGEGARVWQECLAATPPAPQVLVSTTGVGEPAGARYGPPALIAPRLGQGAFRFAVADAYGRACAVTNEHSRPVLEAAHIKPYALNGPHRVSNGILLRSDLHKLFDLGYLTVTLDLRLQVSPRLKAEWQNGREYYAHNGEPLRFHPADPANRPSPEFLKWHNESRFQT